MDSTTDLSKDQGLSQPDLESEGYAHLLFIICEQSGIERYPDIRLS